MSARDVRVVLITSVVAVALVLGWLTVSGAWDVASHAQHTKAAAPSTSQP